MGTTSVPATPTPGASASRAAPPRSALFAVDTLRPRSTYGRFAFGRVPRVARMSKAALAVQSACWLGGTRNSVDHSLPSADFQCEGRPRERNQQQMILCHRLQDKRVLHLARKFFPCREPTHRKARSGSFLPRSHRPSLRGRRRLDWPADPVGWRPRESTEPPWQARGAHRRCSLCDATHKVGLSSGDFVALSETWNAEIAFKLELFG